MNKVKIVLLAVYGGMVSGISELSNSTNKIVHVSLDDVVSVFIGLDPLLNPI